MMNSFLNKVIGENEKCIFYFMEKTIWTIWPTQYYRYQEWEWGWGVLSGQQPAVCSSQPCAWGHRVQQLDFGRGWGIFTVDFSKGYICMLS